MQKMMVLMAIFLFGACAHHAGHKPAPQEFEADWTPLLDATLSGWDTYLSYRFTTSYDGTKPVGEPIGLNSPEAASIFSTLTEGGDTVLRVSGEIYGGISTKASFRNYRLKLKVRWGETKWEPRRELLRDSGVLYHAVGPHGAEYWRSWMQSQEFQIMEGHMGDFWSQATSAMDVRAYTPEYIMNPIASTTQPFLSVGHNEAVKGLVIRSDNHESPHGEWTELELVCFEGQSLHIVNGHVVMVLKESRYEHNGEVIPLVEGKIQLQSEAAEVFYKDIAIMQIEALPAEYAALFEDE